MPRKELILLSSASAMRLSARGLHDLLTVNINTIVERLPHGDAHHLLAGGFESIGGRLAPFIIDADHHRSAVRHAGQQSFLDGGIIADRAMAIDMVLAQS